VKIPSDLPIAGKDKVARKKINEILQALRDEFGEEIELPKVDNPPATWSQQQEPVKREWRPNPIKPGWFFDEYGINRRSEAGEVPPEVLEKFGGVAND